MTGICYLGAAPLLAQKLQQDRPSDLAVKAYAIGVQELLNGDSHHAKLNAQRALKLDQKFADALALEATADLQQREFASAKREASRAIKVDPSDEKAWVILATAENYMAQYGEAAEALRQVGAPDAGDWQFAYQRARAEAGMGDGAAALEWTDRAALYAPANFAPLHLLHASALLAAGQYGRAADELESYLQLAGEHAPQRRALLEELAHLRRLTGARASAGGNAEKVNPVPNALAN